MSHSNREHWHRYVNPVIGYKIKKIVNGSLSYFKNHMERDTKVGLLVLQIIQHESYMSSTRDFPESTAVQTHSLADTYLLMDLLDMS